MDKAVVNSITLRSPLWRTPKHGLQYMRRDVSGVERDWGVLLNGRSKSTCDHSMVMSNRLIWVGKWALNSIFQLWLRGNYQVWDK